MCPCSSVVKNRTETFVLYVTDYTGVGIHLSCSVPDYTGVRTQLSCSVLEYTGVRIHLSCMLLTTLEYGYICLVCQEQKKINVSVLQCSQEQNKTNVSVLQCSQ
jgi:hypothetical protein